MNFLRPITLIVGIMIVLMSFLFEEEKYSVYYNEEAKKNTHFTRLTKLVHNIYATTVMGFVFLVFSLNN